MKMIKKRAPKIALKMTHVLVVLVMLLQPVGSPGLVRAVAEAPATEPVSESFQYPVVASSESLVKAPVLASEEEKDETEPVSEPDLILENEKNAPEEETGESNATTVVEEELTDIEAGEPVEEKVTDPEQDKATKENDDATDPVVDVPVADVPVVENPAEEEIVGETTGESSAKASLASLSSAEALTVATYSDNNYSTEKSQYQQDETVYIKANGLFVSRYYRVDVFEPDNTKHNVYNCKQGNTEATATYVIPASATESDQWRVEIKKYNLSGDCNNENEMKDSVVDTFAVLAPEQPDPVCGDGIKNGEEQCDDGNDVNDDACSNQCVPNETKWEMKKIDVQTCNGEGELYTYTGDVFQDFSTSFTTQRDQLLIFTGNPPAYSLDVEVDGAPAGKTKVFADQWVEIFSVDTAPGAVVTVEGSSENGARNVQGYLAQDKDDPIYDISATEVIWDNTRTSYMYLTPGEYSYLFFDKYTYNTKDNQTDGKKDQREVNVIISGLNTIVDKIYTAPFPSPAEGAVVENYSITQTGTYAMTVDTEDSVYWVLPKCEPLVPIIEVNKTADPTTLPEPGGDVTFTFTVTNTGIDPVTITSLEDNIFETLAGDADCQVGTKLASNESCVFDKVETISGNGGKIHTNVFTAHAKNNEGVDATDDDDATVEVTDSLPTVTLEKTVDDDSKPEPGGTFNYTLTITNTSAENVTIIELTDDNALSQECMELIGDVLIPSQQATCNYSVLQTEAGTYPNTAAVTVEDNEKNTATDDDDAAVEVTDVLPDVTVLKTGNPKAVPETGGDVNFTYRVTNSSGEDVEITFLSDDKFGTLAGDADCQLGTVLAVGAFCEFEAVFAVPAGDVTDTHVDVFTATVSDNENNTATDTDDETITYTDVLPVIEVLKTAGVSSLDVPSAGVTFTFTVTNNSIEPVTITSLEDDIFGTLTGDDDCQVGTVLDPGAACSFESAEIVSGIAGAAHKNVFTAHAEDNEKNDVAASDDETIIFNAGRIIVDKVTVPAEDPQSFNFTLSGGPESAVNEIFSLTDSAVPYDSGLIFPGTYNVMETVAAGWQTGAECQVENQEIFEQSLEVFTNSIDPNNIVLEPNQTIRCVFTNTFTTPSLTIEKFNEQWPLPQAVGSIVDYVITVRSFENDVNNVVVKDLLPHGFSFNSITSVKKNGDLLTVADPAYASPGTWNLGNMQAEDEIVIRFKANIGAAQEAGTYKDLAWAVGTDLRMQAVLATSVVAVQVDSGVVTDNFVGTQIALAPTVSESVILAEKTKTETKTKRKTKRVLGAAILPATGGSPVWPGVAMILLIIGFNLIMEARKMKKKNDAAEGKIFAKILAIAFFASSFMFSGGAEAASGSIAVRIEDPKTPISAADLKIGFVVLDIEGRNLSAQCYNAKDNTPITTEYVSIAGGNSGNCVINSFSDGTYNFYVTAGAGADSAVSKNVIVEINSASPGSPLNYHRDKDSCSVTFTTADDGLTSGVELYRSKALEFTADDSTYVGTAAIGPNAAGSLTDANADCGGDYYYAIRAISESGAGSGFVGDEKINVKRKTKTKTTTKIIHPIAESGAIPVAVGTETESSPGEGEAGALESGEGIVEGAKTIQPEEDGDVLGEKIQEDENGDAQAAQKNKWLIPILVLLFIIAIYAYQRKRNPVEKK